MALAVVELASEAIANAAIHGTARHVTIDVGLTDNDLEVVARDNGIGLAHTRARGRLLLRLIG